jgi:hypothetical protein
VLAVLRRQFDVLTVQFGRGRDVRDVDHVVLLQHARNGLPEPDEAEA